MLSDIKNSLLTIDQNFAVFSELKTGKNIQPATTGGSLFHKIQGKTNQCFQQTLDLIGFHAKITNAYSKENFEKVMEDYQNLNDEAFTTFKTIFEKIKSDEFQKLTLKEKEEFKALARKAFHHYIKARNGLHTWSYTLREKKVDHLNERIRKIDAVLQKQNEHVRNLFRLSLQNPFFSEKEILEKPIETFEMDEVVKASPTSSKEGDKIENAHQALLKFHKGSYEFEKDLQEYQKELDPYNNHPDLHEALQIGSYEKLYSDTFYLQEKLNEIFQKKEKIDQETLEKRIDSLHQLFVQGSGSYQTSLGGDYLISLLIGATETDAISEEADLFLLLEKLNLNSIEEKFPISKKKLWQTVVAKRVFSDLVPPFQELQKELQGTNVSERTKKQLNEILAQFELTKSIAERISITT